MVRKVVLNKYRNELGKMYRRYYEAGVRNTLCSRSAMRSYQCRKDDKSGTIVTFIQDNLILELYE